MDLDFMRPNDEEYIMQLESELEKLKVEKELGWVDNDTSTKNTLDREMLNQEIARLGEKVKRQNHKMEEYKKKETDWNDRESKYQTTCKNFKKTIAEQKKELDLAKSSTKVSKSFETMFADHTKLKKTYEETINLFHGMVTELTLENRILREEQLKKKNFNVDFIESTMAMFGYDETSIKV